jgi:hypothetical protein
MIDGFADRSVAAIQSKSADPVIYSVAAAAAAAAAAAFDLPGMHMLYPARYYTTNQIFCVFPCLQ